jgi:hypothetical protein
MSVMGTTYDTHLRACGMASLRSPESGGPCPHRVSLIELAIGDSASSRPATHASVKQDGLDGMSGSSTYSQVMGAAQRGAPMGREVGLRIGSCHSSIRQDDWATRASCVLVLSWTIRSGHDRAAD